MSSIVAHIMTRELRTLPSTASLKEAHELIRDTGIRHIPIMEDGRLLGVLTQKKLLAKVMSLMMSHPIDELDALEAKIPVTDLVDCDCHRVAENEPLVEAVEFFLNNKHGCLPVVDEDGKLQGMITSSDFVRLCAHLLDHRH
ncbi:CBS domain-containing protein [Gallaecimonas sp. GXIMD4217]|uniref:CBS domain-containing protein n=1 Tax=Gallaecimonas sp. GXIMD4217 TaxID=3131927 RepID=UPI00311B18AC